MNTIENSLYERDFYAWVYQQATLLKQSKFAEADLYNIVEELETLGRSEKRSLNSRLEVLIQHLLKWQFQPDMNGTSWNSTIIEQRERLNELLKDSPSLKPKLRECVFLEKAWNVAVKKAVAETGLSKSTFPSTPIWSVEQILDENFYPEPKKETLGE